jgi:hypothetical protein
MKRSILYSAVLIVFCGCAGQGTDLVRSRTDFNPYKDLISLHYDYAPDKDDGQSAAADRSMLQTLMSQEWIKHHTVAVSGTYGLNKDTFNKQSDNVMDAVWGDVGWIAANDDWQAAVEALTDKWLKIINNGGNIWIKEGGQSDMTADVIKRIVRTDSNLKIQDRIFVVQHSDWNEEQTTPEALAYVKNMATYIRINDANRYLNIKGGDVVFVKAALAHPNYGKYWKAAFDYYPPTERLDFSDTGELFHILKRGELGVNAFKEHFLR